MSGYTDLVAAAQVGTRKVSPERATEFALEGPERTLLLELGAVGLMRRAGATSTTAEPIPAAPPETSPTVEVADALEQALDESLPAALEWARAAAERGIVAPPAVVARLIPLATKHPELRQVLGARGRWLAEINGVAIDLPEADLPSSGEWDGLDPKARALLVAKGPDELALFERALADRRKEVREAAVERLVLLPQSSQARELRRLASDAVRVEKGFLRNRLAVEPPEPETLPKWLPRSAPRGGVGKKAAALLDLLAHLPPDFWDVAPADLLALARGTDEAQALREGWQDAALRFRSSAWIDALTLLPPQEFPQRMGEIFPLASSGAFEKAALAWLRPGERDLSATIHDLKARSGPLSLKVSRALVEAIRVAVRNGRDRYLDYYLPDLASTLDLSTLQLVDGLDDKLQATRARWRKILDLRRRLQESLR